MFLFKNSSCSCPSDLWRCEPSQGCVCPPGEDCGIQAGHEVVINYLQAEGEAGPGPDTRVGMIAGIVLSVVIIASVIACLIVVYYRYFIANIMSRAGVSFAGGGCL